MYEEREFWGAETVVPSTLPMLVVLFVVFGGTLVGTGATVVLTTGAVAPRVAAVVAFAVYLCFTVGVSGASYRYAVRRYRTYTLE
ncbi:hypothetical protein [Halobaculum litoreum]|uniref:hypothetical protein n=1 Tax=Halobaculum litoreum TaxID=3031998 RepID=UPI003D80C6C0